MKNLWVKGSEKVGKSKTEVIMLYLSRAGRASTQEIADALDCSANTARKWLYRAHSSGLIEWKSHYYGRGIYLMLWYIPKNNSVVSPDHDNV